MLGEAAQVQKDKYHMFSLKSYFQFYVLRVELES